MGTKKSLRAQIDGIHLEMFRNLKEANNFKYDSEVVRYCISEASKQTEFRLEDSYWSKIKQLLKYDFIKSKYHLYNVSSFINKAIESYIEELESNVKSILSFEVRSLLDGTELEVAIAFIDCQSKSDANQVDVDTLAKKMGKRNISELQKILDDFVRRGFLINQVHNNITYYHAKSVNP